MSEKRDRHFVDKVSLCLSSHSFPVKQWGFPFPYCSPSYRYIQWNMDCSFSLFLLFILHMLALLVTKDRKTVTDDIFRFTKRVDEHSQYRFTRDNLILSNSIALYVVAHCIHAHSLASNQWKFADNIKLSEAVCTSGLFFRGTLTGWRNRHTPHEVQWKEMQNEDEITPSKSATCGLTVQEADLQTSI